ncbi:MAG: PEP-CTERM sorting domain-containing protein [Acidobacteria bacterium]|nr:PEP-CTERM sorting domain-containing protein [Acidobacteriota bacterium]
MRIHLFILAAASTVAFAGPITIDVNPALAPNGFGSPSYASWRTNALNALYNGTTTAGTPGTPAYYEQRTQFFGNEVMVTSFPSWLGQVDPGSVFGPAFASELGNRILFGLVVNGNGTQFSISQLSFTAFSTDPFDALGFTFAAGSYNYGADYVGILAGDDLQVFTSDDVFVTAGPNTQLVDALIGRGSGNALWPCGPGDPHPCTNNAERQIALNDMANYNDGLQYLFQGTYRISDGATVLAETTGTAVINSVPEPATSLLLAAGLLALACARRRS